MSKIYLRVIRQVAYGSQTSINDPLQPSIDAAIAACGDGPRVTSLGSWAPSGALNWGTGEGTLPLFDGACSVFQGDGTALPVTISSFSNVIEGRSFLQGSSAPVANTQALLSVAGNGNAIDSLSLKTPRYLVGVGGVSGLGGFVSFERPVTARIVADQQPLIVNTTPLPIVTSNADGSYVQSSGLSSQQLRPLPSPTFGSVAVSGLASGYTMAIADLQDAPNVAVIGLFDVTYAIEVPDFYVQNEQTVLTDLFLAIPIHGCVGVVGVPAGPNAFVAGSPSIPTPGSFNGGITISLQTIKQAARTVQGYFAASQQNNTPSSDFPTVRVNKPIGNVACGWGFAAFASLGTDISSAPYDALDLSFAAPEPLF